MAVQQVTCAESRFESIEGADPWVRFVFKYATREALVALGITSQLAPRTVIHSHNATRERSTTPSEAFVLVPASPEQAVVATRSLETPSGLSVTTPTHDIAGSELARPVESSDSSLLNEKESRAEDSAVEMEETGFGESAVDYTSLLDVCLQNQVQANLHDPAETFSKLVTVPIPEVTSSKQGEQAVYEDEEDYQALYEALSLIPPEDLRTLDAALVDYATVSETTMSADLQPRAGKTSATTTTIIKDKHRRTKPAHSHIRTTDLSTSSAFASRPAVPTLTSTSGSSLHRPTQSQTRSTTIPAQSGHMDINQRKRKERSLDQDTNNIHGHRSSRDDRTYHESMRSRESGTTTMHKDKKRGTDSRTRLREKVEPLFFTEELWSSDDDSRHAYTVKSRTTLVHKHSHSHSHSHGHSHGHSLRIGFDDTIASKLTSRDHFASKAGSSSRGHVVSKAESSSRKHVVLEAGSSSRGHVVSKAGSSSRGHVVSKAESSSRDHAASKAGSSSRRQIRSTQPPLLSRLRSQLEPDDLPSSQLRSITAFPAHPKSKRKH
ncbi:hypothetical protein BCR39DRAFT_323368 [Naematelia encephala]|uniref:Uncharacterized protein n=1 Tax=Naematelia encephala TaxID=71784 RepID=A0A1Y2AQ73_9TREE|nr:hypothetical protein BCR39DRAFT_323368 [Naematelia encephala]